MKILHFADRLSARGGADIHLLALLDAQASDHDVHVAAGLIEAQTPASVHACTGLDARTEAPCAAGALIDELSPDIVHVHNVMNPTALEAATQHPCVITVQDHRVFCPTRGKWTLAGDVCTEPMSAELCRDCFDDEAYGMHMLALTQSRWEHIRDAPLVVLSDYMRGQLEQLGASRVTVIPPFVYDLDTNAEPDGEECVLFVGRLVAAKGVHDAVAIHRAMQTDLPLVFAGSGSARQDLEAIEGVEVTGWLDRTRLARTLARARVLLFPPRWQEPFGIAGLEALTAGVPVAAWDSGGVREWCDDVTPWGDIEVIAERARTLVGSRAEPPPRFGRAPLMARLLALYDSVR